MRRRWAGLCIVLPAALLCWALTLSGGQTPPPADNPGSSLSDLLNPPQVCPHCHQSFREDRSVTMLLIGFLGQILFTSRFLAQWIASERRGESYVPVVFWYLSIGGSLLLLAYATSIRAWPIILGQMFGVIVYGRNLALIARSERRKAEESEGRDEAARDT